MKKLWNMKKQKKVAENLMALSLLAFIIGIIIFIWIGFVGIKIMFTSFTLMVFLYLFSKSVNEIIIKIAKEKSNETD